MKACFKCRQKKSLNAFYEHSQTADGYLNKCKDCTKIDTQENRKKNINHYRNYDKNRGNRQDKGYVNEWRKSNPRKYKVQTMVGNYLRDGKIIKQGCEICGRKKDVHAHHDDYSKPLDIRWLCPPHHKQWHDENGEGING